MAGFQTLRARDLDLGSSHLYCIPSCISHHSTHIPNYIEIEETFCGRTDVRTYVCTATYVRRMLGWTDGRTFETGFIRSTLSKSPHKNEILVGV